MIAGSSSEALAWNRLRFAQRDVERKTEPPKNQQRGFVTVRAMPDLDTGQNGEGLPRLPGKEKCADATLPFPVAPVKYLADHVRVEVPLVVHHSALHSGHQLSPIALENSAIRRSPEKLRRPDRSAISYKHCAEILEIHSPRGWQASRHVHVGVLESLYSARRDP